MSNSLIACAALDGSILIIPPSHIENVHMMSMSRRSRPLEAQYVETGIDIARSEGVGPALDYMLSHAIPKDVALRVLADPNFQRHFADRRRWTRRAEDLSMQGSDACEVYKHALPNR